MLYRLSMLLILLTLAYSGLGQQLPKGTFILSTGFTNTEITFRGKSRFEYKSSSCTDAQEGVGTYSFQNKELVLLFKNPKKKLMPKMPSIQRQQATDSNSYLNFTFYDQKDLTPALGVVVWYQNKADSTTYWAQSNLEGTAGLKIENRRFPLELEVSAIGTARKRMRLDTSGNYAINYPLNFEFMKTLALGDTLKFAVDKYDDKRLVLKPVGDKAFRTFTRQD